MREFLASEAMHWLGVSTTRAISLVVSETDVVERPWFSPDHRNQIEITVRYVHVLFFKCCGDLFFFIYHRIIPVYNRIPASGIILLKLEERYAEKLTVNPML